MEIREQVQEIEPGREPAMPEAEPVAPSLMLFGGLSADALLNIGVPRDWIDTVRGSTEDGFLAVSDHLPPEASEALLEYAVTGMLPVVAQSRPAPAAEEFLDFTVSPDTQRRFRVVENVEELEAALDWPWERWTVFLHPSQRQVVERSFSGPARIAGSAGTGKTVVAIHRAVRLAEKHPDGRILLTTFSRPLAVALERKLRILVGERSSVIPKITVAPFRGIAEELYQLAFGRRPQIVSERQVGKALAQAAEVQGVDLGPQFLVSEWANVVDAWQIGSLQGYADVPRIGRKNRLGSKQRERLWPVFEQARRILDERRLKTWPQVFADVTRHYAERADKPFAHIVVDEAQDLGVPELRFLAGVAADSDDALFFAGDLGQRIFQLPFSWLSLGVDVRGRSQVLKVNYRTSHQIREAADRLLPKAIRDVDGIEEDRRATVSVFNGPAPDIDLLPDEAAEADAVAGFITRAMEDGILLTEIGVFVRTRDQLAHARTAIDRAGQTSFDLTDSGEAAGDRIAVGTMHLAKGLEFRAVVVMACDDNVLPLASRIETVADEVELDTVYETERQLFYVACTRARDRLFVSGVAPGSGFLRDLGHGG